MERIGKHNMILATGHISQQGNSRHREGGEEDGPEESRRDARRVPVAEPDGRQQKALVDEGAFIEHCFTTTYTNKAPWETAFANIRKSGVAKTVISTDLGQTIDPAGGRRLRDVRPETPGRRITS